MHVLELLAARGIRPKRLTGSSKLICPKCNGGSQREYSLSLTIEEDSAVWLCHRAKCGWKGTTSENRVQRPSPIVPSNTDEDELYNWFLTERKISRGTVDRFQVKPVRRSNGRLWAALPYIKANELVNVKYRGIPDKRFHQTADCERSLFGVDFVAAEKTVYVVEGELDVMAMWEAGYIAVSLPDGSPSPGQISEKRYVGFETCYHLIEHVDKWVLCPDLDDPGRNHMKEVAKRLGPERCWIVDWPEKDANDTLRVHGVEGIKKAVESAKPHPIRALNSVADYRPEIAALYETGYGRGLTSGWEILDEFYTLRPGELTVVTGTPGSGKTSWLTALCANAAERHDWRFAMCTMENPPTTQIINLAEIYLGLPFGEGPSERMSKAQLDTALGWAERHFHIIHPDHDGCTIEFILEKARVAVMRYGIKGLVIDPWNRIESASGTTDPNYIANALSRIHSFCKNQGVHVWLVAHPTKPNQFTNGSLYSIAGSANFYNMVDNGIIVVRNRETNLTEIKIEKVRFRNTGKIGSVTLKFDRVNSRFTEATPEDMENLDEFF